MAQNPSVLMWSIAGMEEARNVPKMLTGMEQIDDLNGAGKVLVGNVTYPFGSVSSAPSPMMTFLSARFQPRFRASR
jgi:hypothetical protein